MSKLVTLFNPEVKDGRPIKVVDVQDMVAENNKYVAGKLIFNDRVVNLDMRTCELQPSYFTVGELIVS